MNFRNGYSRNATMVLILTTWFLGASVSCLFAQQKTPAMKPGTASVKVVPADTIHFLIEYVSGSVMENHSTVVDIVKSRSAEHALKPFLTGNRKAWVIHPDSRTSCYARAENPASFVSDMINYYSASACVIEKDTAGRMLYEVEFVEQLESYKENVKNAGRVWAADPCAAIRLVAQGDHVSWACNNLDPKNISGQMSGPVSQSGYTCFYRARAVIKYIQCK